MICVSEGRGLEVGTKEALFVTCGLKKAARAKSNLTFWSQGYIA